MHCRNLKNIEEPVPRWADNVLPVSSPSIPNPRLPLEVVMNICFILPPTEFFNPISGGALSTIAHTVGSELLKRGHGVTVLAPKDKNGFYSAPRAVQIQSTVKSELSLVQRAMARLSSIDGEWPYYSLYAKSCLSALRSAGSVDVFILFNDQALPALLRAEYPEAGIVLAVQNELAVNRFTDSAKGNVDLFATCTKFIAEHMNTHLGVPQEKITVTPSGVDNTEYQPRPDYLDPPEQIRFLFLGRIDPNKGPDIMLEVFERLITEFPNLAATIIGDIWWYPIKSTELESYSERLKTRAKLLGVTHKGLVPRTQLPASVRLHDVSFVLSRSNEPFGLVVLEAMASGLVVIASNRGGLPEACGGAGILVDPDNIDEIVAKVRQLLSDPATLAKHKKAAVERALRQSWTFAAANYEEACYKVQTLKKDELKCRGTGH